MTFNHETSHFIELHKQQFSRCPVAFAPSGYSLLTTAATVHFTVACPAILTPRPDHYEGLSILRDEINQYDSGAKCLPYCFPKVHQSDCKSM